MDLEKISTKAKKYGVPIIRTESHKFLEEFVKTHQPKNILEIGTAVGYSGITMLNVTNANLFTIEHEKKLADIAKENFKNENLSNRVKIINDDALVALSNMIYERKYDEFFDMIFLDGPKAQYLILEKLAYPLLKKGGYLVADNVLFRGYTSDENSAPTRRYKTIIKRLNDFIKNCKNEEKYCEFELKNIEDGIIIAKKV